MTTEVDVCNRALGAMGGRTSISSLSETSPEAEECNLRYAAVRDSLLRAADWGFAEATDVLTLNKSLPGSPGSLTAAEASWSTNFPQPPWWYEYAYPASCLAVRWIIPQGSYGLLINQAQGSIIPQWQSVALPFKIATNSDKDAKVILTNAQTAVCVYTTRITDPDLWSSDFEQAMVSKLAADLAIPLSGDKVLAQGNEQLARDRVAEARATDANEGVRVLNNEPDWLRARGSVDSEDNITRWS